MTAPEVFGEKIEETLPDALTLPVAVAAWHAVDRHRDFTLIEARRYDAPDGCCETLIVDCDNDGVPTHNPIGIKYRERLALTFSRDQLPQVFALRPDFPLTAHQNTTDKESFRNPCIYVERWAALRRIWTAEKHLERIQWWFAATASGTLHRPDQPLEQLYFQSAYQFVVPHDFTDRLNSADHELIVDVRQARGQKRFTLVGRFAPVGKGARGGTDYSCIALAVPPVVHGPIEETPLTLGELHDQLERRGSSLASALAEEIKGRCVNGQFPVSKAGKTLLALSTPLKRDAGSEPETVDIRGFIVLNNIADLGLAIGALDKTDKGYWSVPLFKGSRAEAHDWRGFEIVQVEILSAFTPAIGRQASGIAGQGPKGVVAGVGALGADIYDLWARAGWGQWTLIDGDQLRPHNLARHHALECHVGHNKVDIVKSLGDALIPGQPSRAAAIADLATNIGNEEVKSALEDADLVVDVTTTLEFPRDLSANDKVRRAVSTFVTPSGRGAVMLLEDKGRTIRLDCLEAQYYRRVISEPWGADHLAGNMGHLWTGAGCRDVSTAIPNELIGVHGANLAAMVRQRAAQDAAALLVWRYEAANGSLAVDEPALATPIVERLSDFEIVWDSEIREKVRAQRAARLPKETGGVLLGYSDLVLKRVFIVDALPAPGDSKEEDDGFVRGTDGLVDAVKNASERTGHIVEYVGEWHSHPPDHSASPSIDDLLLLRHLAIALTHDGRPALMLIVGEKDEGWLAAREIHDLPEGDQ